AALEHKLLASLRDGGLRPRADAKCTVTAEPEERRPQHTPLQARRGRSWFLRPTEMPPELSPYHAVEERRAQDASASRQQQGLPARSDRDPSPPGGAPHPRADESMR